MNTEHTATTATQLSLLDLPGARRRPSGVVNPRFKLSKETCDLGMRKVAEIRQVLAEREAAREAALRVSMPPRTRQAA